MSQFMYGEYCPQAHATQILPVESCSMHVPPERSVSETNISGVDHDAPPSEDVLYQRSPGVSGMFLAHTNHILPPESCMIEA